MPQFTVVRAKPQSSMAMQPWKTQCGQNRLIIITTPNNNNNNNNNNDLCNSIHNDRLIISIKACGVAFRINKWW